MLGQDHGPDRVAVPSQAGLGGDRSDQPSEVIGSWAIQEGGYLSRWLVEVSGVLALRAPWCRSPSLIFLALGVVAGGFSVPGIDRGDVGEVLGVACGNR